MAQLRQDYQAFIDREAEVVVVGPDNPGAFLDYFSEHELPFIGIPDPKHIVLKEYGQQVKLFKLGRMPAQAIIDKRGIVRYIHYGHEMSDIPDNAELLGLLDELRSVEGNE
jgi:peroxiredoxin